MNMKENFIRTLYFWELTALIIPNVLLSLTRGDSLALSAVSVLLPAAVYGLLLCLGRRTSFATLLLFPAAFFGAFQLVLLSLNGSTVIAADMFLNVVTTNPGEAFEVLDNLIPAVAAVVLLYLPPLIMAFYAAKNGVLLPRRFQRRGICGAMAAFVCGLVCIPLTDHYRPLVDQFPLDACHNLRLAVERGIKTRKYLETSADFSFHARSSRPDSISEVYVLVIGETSRAENWQLGGYGRPTNPCLGETSGVFYFPNAASQSNTTHKSVPMLMSDIDALCFDSIYFRKGIAAAFKEAGYATDFISNQRRNRSFIDFFGEEADKSVFIKEEDGREHFDGEMLPLVRRVLEEGHNKQLVVLHTYGSHFDYSMRYPSTFSVFKPDGPIKADASYRDVLMNAYDNTIVYTDYVLCELIGLLRATGRDAVVIYTSDHGEDIFDDDDRHFLHASPVPTVHQLRVPLLVWASESYRERHPDVISGLEMNLLRNVSTSSCVFHTLVDMAGISCSRLNKEKSAASDLFSEDSELYLNDHNEAVDASSFLRE